jgi:hypothetical protein
VYQDVYVYIVVNASRPVLRNSQKIKELVLMCNHRFKKSKKPLMNCGLFAGSKSIGPLKISKNPEHWGLDSLVKIVKNWFNMKLEEPPNTHKTLGLGASTTP